MTTETKKDYSKLIQQLKDKGLHKQAEALQNKQDGKEVNTEKETPRDESSFWGDDRGFVSYAGETAVGVPIGAMTAIQEVAETNDWAVSGLQDKFGDLVFYDTDDDSVTYQAYEDAGGLHLFDLFGKRAKWVNGADLQKLKEDNLYRTLKVGELVDPVLYDKGEAREDGVIDSAAGEMSAGISQFIAGWTLLAPAKPLQIAKGSNLGLQITQATTKGAIVDFAAFDAHEERLSNLAIELGIENEVTLYLAADKEDTVLEGKIKNAIEGTGIGLTFEGSIRAASATMKFIKAIRSKRQGDLEEAARLAEEARKEAFKDAGDVKIVNDKGETIVVPDPSKSAARAEENAQTKTADETVNEPTAKQDSDDLVDELNSSSTTKALDESIDPDDGVESYKVRFDEEQAPVGGTRPDVDDPKQGLDTNIPLRQKVKDFRGKDGKTTKQISWKETGSAAKRLINNMLKDSTNNQGIINLAKRMYNMEVNVRDWETYGLATKALEKEIWKTYKALMKTPAAKTGDINTIRQLDALAEALKYAQAANRGASSQSGRLLNLQKMLKEFIPELDMKMSADEVFRVLSDPATAGRLRKSFKSFNRLTEVVNEYWINSLLSGLSTQMINLASNALVMGLNNLEMFGAVGSAIFRGDLKQASKNFTLAQRQFIGTFKYLKISAKVSAQTLRAGRNILDEESMVSEAVDNIVGEVAIGRGNFDILKGWGEAAKKGEYVDLAGNFIRLPSRLLMTGDEFFKQLNFRAKAYAYAAEELYKNGGKNLNAKDFDAGVEKLIDEAYEIAKQSRKGDKISNDIAKKAMEAARRNTFTNDLGESGKAFQGFVGKVPILRQIVPFIRTPLNIVKYPLKRAPILHTFSTEFKQALKAGGAEADRARAAIAMGYMYWTGALLAVLQKTEITNEDGNTIEVYKYQGTWGNDSSAQKAVKRATGGQPNSYVNKDGTFTAYNRADPLAMFIGIAADMRDVFIYGGEDAQATDIGNAAIIAFASVFKEKTYTKGVSDFVQAFDEPERYWTKYMEQKVGSFMPSFVNQFNTDDVVRQIRSPLDALLNRTPVLSKTLEPSFDIFGTPKPKTEGFLFKDSKFLNTDVAQELFQLAPNISKLSEIQQGVDLTQYQVVNPDGETVSAYARLNEIIASDRVKLLEKLEKKINRSSYQNRRSSGLRTTEGVIGNTKEDEIQEIFADARAKALKILKRENPELKAEFKRIEDIIKNAGKQRTIDEAREQLLN